MENKFSGCEYCIRPILLTKMKILMVVLCEQEREFFIKEKRILDK